MKRNQGDEANTARLNQLSDERTRRRSSPMESKDSNQTKAYVNTTLVNVTSAIDESTVIGGLSQGFKDGNLQALNIYAREESPI